MTGKKHNASAVRRRATIARNRAIRRQIDFDMRYALNLSREQDELCSYAGCNWRRKRSKNSLFNRVRRLGECQVCLNTAELYNTCPKDSACRDCIRKYIDIQLPTRQMKCVGCNDEMSVEAVNVSVNLSDMKKVEAHYARRSIPYTRVPSRCPQCHIQVEKVGGCNGSTFCYCGANFCHRCGRYYSDCGDSCPWFDWDDYVGLMTDCLLAVLCAITVVAIIAGVGYILMRNTCNHAHKADDSSNISDSSDTKDTTNATLSIDAPLIKETEHAGGSTHCQKNSELLRELKFTESPTKHRCFTAYPFMYPFMGMKPSIVCW